MSDKMKQIIGLLLGPLAFFAVYSLNLEGLDPKAHMSLSIYSLMVVWWVFKPIPWIATGIASFALFPILNVMSAKEIVAMLMGQRIMIFLIFVFLLGKAIQKYGLGERLSLNLLSIKWIKGSTERFIVMFMVAEFVMFSIFSVPGHIVSMSVAATVLNYISNECDKAGIKYNKVKFNAKVILAGAYGMVAGAMVTIQAAPANALVLSIYEEQTGQAISYIQWLLPGIVMGCVFLVAAYFTIKLMFRTDLKEIPGGREYFLEQKEKLGKITFAEKMLTAHISITVLVWIVSTFIKLPGLSFYTIAFISLFMLYILPNGKKSALIDANEIKTINWDIIFLVTVAVGFSGVLSSLGVIQYVASNLQGLNGFSLLLISAIVTPLMTNFLAGMATAATMSTLLIPLLAQTTIHPLVGAKIIALSSIGLIFPWGGTAAAITYGSQKLGLKEMSTTGFVMVPVLAIVLIVINMLFMNVSWLYPPL